MVCFQEKSNMSFSSQSIVYINILIFLQTKVWSRVYLKWFLIISRHYKANIRPNRALSILLHTENRTKLTISSTFPLKSVPITTLFSLEILFTISSSLLQTWSLSSDLYLLVGHMRWDYLLALLFSGLLPTQYIFLHSLHHISQLYFFFTNHS